MPDNAYYDHIYTLLISWRTRAHSEAQVSKEATRGPTVSPRKEELVISSANIIICRRPLQAPLYYYYYYYYSRLAGLSRSLLAIKLDGHFHPHTGTFMYFISDVHTGLGVVCRGSALWLLSYECTFFCRNFKSGVLHIICTFVLETTPWNTSLLSLLFLLLLLSAAVSPSMHVVGLLGARFTWRKGRIPRVYVQQGRRRVVLTKERTNS